MSARLSSIVGELKQREAWAKAIRADMFDKQLNLHDDPAQFKECHSARRGGKSDGMPKSTCLDALNAGPNEVVLIGAETLKKARSLHWGNLNIVVKKHGLPFTPNKSDACWNTPWGAVIQFWGMNDDDAVELLRGYNLRGVRFDEVATFASKLPKLVDSVLEPALGDTDGQLTLYSSPSVTRSGGWFDICEGKFASRWTHHHWDARQNPHFRKDKGGAEAWFRAILTKNGWEWDEATFQREYLGLFVNDSSSQVYRYVPERDDCQPQELRDDGRPLRWDRDQWAHVVGVDFGTVRDACAWTAIGSHPEERITYALESFSKTKLTTDEAAHVTAEVCERYRPLRLVGDLGGLGAPYALEWNKRHAGKELVPGYTLPPMICADKLGKRAHIEIVNTELRQKRLRIVKASCQEWCDEAESLPWYKEQRLVEHPAYANHCCDSLLYAFTQHFGYLNEPRQPPKPRPTPDSQAQIELEERDLAFSSSDGREWWQD